MAKSTVDTAFSPSTSNRHLTWGWYVALGVALMLLGIIALANLVIATLASVLFVGAMMTVGGIFQITVALRVRKEGGFFLWLASGLTYAAAGILIFYNPTLAAKAFTLLLAVALILAGVARVMLGIRSRPSEGWGLIVASGVISIIAGAIVMFGWPYNSLFMLGIVLVVDLIFQGASVMSFGLLLRSWDKMSQRRAM